MPLTREEFEAIKNDFEVHIATANFVHISDAVRAVEEYTQPEKSENSVTITRAQFEEAWRGLNSGILPLKLMRKLGFKRQGKDD